MRIESFPPIENPSARVLILGSMPGKESLRMQQYYAHPRNAFWPIMMALVGGCADWDYDLRIEALRSAGIALWDVLASCLRSSSLDSDIDTTTLAVNDFAAFFATHVQIRHVFFNGAMAEKCFLMQVWPRLRSADLQLRRLPSTSPANASMKFADKLSAWRSVMLVRDESLQRMQPVAAAKAD